MSQNDRNILDNGLPAVKRFITTHDDSAAARFSDAIPETLEWQELPDKARFCLGYATNQMPCDLNDGKDIRVYQDFMQNKPGIVVPRGTVCRLVEMLPGALSPMHRTVSIDYGVVLEGRVELVLDSGEVRLMQRGDMSVQRGTNHAWKNASETEWARMLYVLTEAEPLQVAGKALEEDYGGIPGVRPSGK